MCDLLRPTVHKTVCDYACRAGIDNPKLVVTEASKNGESYSGEVYRIVMTPDEQDLQDHANNNNKKLSPAIPIPKEIRLIAKIPPKNALRRQMYNSASHFAREKYVYEHVFPALEHFQLQHLTEAQIFRNYPRMYAASNVLEDEYVLLDDLSATGYHNVDRTSPLGFDKCALVFTHLARFHAASFALKDQQPEQFAQVAGELNEILFVDPINEAFDGFLKNNIGYALTTLDRDRDRLAVDKIMAFGQIYGQFMVECCAEREDAVILHGDCWISNLMFKEDKDGIEEVKFLDWQVGRYGTVAIDLSYFLFCCTDTELRMRLPELLNIYHGELVQRIDELGSDGQRLFPFEKLLWHMTKYSRFGLGMALMTLHATCCSSSDLANVQSTLDTTDLANLGDICLPMLKNPAYRKRMSGVCKDLVRFGYL